MPIKQNEDYFPQKMKRTGGKYLMLWGEKTETNSHEITQVRL